MQLFLDWINYCSLFYAFLVLLVTNLQPLGCRNATCCTLIRLHSTSDKISTRPTNTLANHDIVVVQYYFCSFLHIQLYHSTNSLDTSPFYTSSSASGSHIVSHLLLSELRDHDYIAVLQLLHLHLSVRLRIDYHTYSHRKLPKSDKLLLIAYAIYHVYFSIRFFSNYVDSNNNWGFNPKRVCCSSETVCDSCTRL